MLNNNKTFMTTYIVSLVSSWKPDENMKIFGLKNPIDVAEKLFPIQFIMQKLFQLINGKNCFASQP